FALDYIWYAVLGGSRKRANIYAPLIVLRGLEGPIPVKLAEGILIDLGKCSDEVIGSEVVRWFAKWHHSTLEKAIEKAARSPVNREKIEPEELYQALVGGFNKLKKRGLIEKEKIAINSGRIIDLIRSGLADDMSQLSEEEKRRCVKRVAFILGHAWALHPSLPRRGDLREEAEAVLGDALEPCVVDDYVTADGEIAPIVLTPLAFEAAGFPSLMRAPAEATEMSQGATSIFSLPASAVSTISLETLKALVDSWRRRGFTPPEALYALGLAVLAAEAEVDEEAADLLLYAASTAMRKVTSLVLVFVNLMVWSPLGEKAPRRFVHLLAAVSELATLDSETVQYIYDALQELRSRPLDAECRCLLVEAIFAYSNLLRKYSAYIWDRREDAVADMCRLYGEVRKRGAAAPEGGLSAQRLFNTIAGAYVLAAALHNEVLAPLVQRHCGLGDLVKEAEGVRSALKEAAARPEELRKIMESDEDFAEWVRAWSPAGDAGEVIKNVRTWFTDELARYKLNHALDERG
ncbi:MAG: hypothetical protein ACO2PN_06150, partial [Pyrobaculum sp.]